MTYRSQKPVGAQQAAPQLGTLSTPGTFWSAAACRRFNGVSHSPNSRAYITNKKPSNPSLLRELCATSVLSVLSSSRL
jgi:hypothetical protein